MKLALARHRRSSEMYAIKLLDKSATQWGAFDAPILAYWFRTSSGGRYECRHSERWYNRDFDFRDYIFEELK